jgi:nicotinate phosphoribosyltransferase
MPRPTSGLCTDLYEIRMALSYLRRGMTAPATFSLFARRLPPDRGFLVACGVEEAIDRILGFGFDDVDLEYLEGVVGIRGDDVAQLAAVRFDGDVRAVPEGRVVLPDEPLLEVTAALPVAQLVETVALNQVTYATAVASKAVRCRLAAGDAAVVDFGARRTHGLEAAGAVARASAIAGFQGTSYVRAAADHGLVPVGTMAHSYVEAFPDEPAAFRAFGSDFPEQAVFLVDTYDTASGVDHAVAVIGELGLAPERTGIRLDSGDLGGLARDARRRLDESGLHAARIVASGGLDEYEVARLVGSGVPIDVYGVGTRMGVSWDAPSLDTAYKLVAYDDRPVMKLSPGKRTLPGAKQVWRGADGEPDTVALLEEAGPPGHEGLLLPHVLRGARVRPPTSVTTAATLLDDDLARLPRNTVTLSAPAVPPVRLSARLTSLTETLAAPGENVPPTR